MYEVTNIVKLFNFILNTKTKRHIVGGALLSISFLFGGLAITVMAMKDDEDGPDDNNTVEFMGTKWKEY